VRNPRKPAKPISVKKCRCGKLFYQTRKGKENCSNGCAVAAWRERKRQRDSMNEAV
jgi:hypothetical protein